MGDNNSNKKKVIMPIVALVVVGALVLLLGTYAYWQVTRKQTNRNLVGSACLDITFSNETGALDLENQWPTSDSDGSMLVPYTFTLTNTCPDELVAYTVALEEIKDDREEPIIYPDDYLSDSNLKIKFDTLAPVKISTLDNITNDDEDDYEIYKTKKIINRKLAGGESRTHSIRMWLDANTPQSEMNKFFLSKIKIIAGQGIEEECYAVNQEGLLYAYDPDCGKSATIPATVDGKQVKTIASDAFKGERTEVKKAYNYYDEYLYDGGKQPKSSALISSVDDFHYLTETCDTRTNAKCELDYSIAFSNEFGEFYTMLSDDDNQAAFMEEHNITDEQGLITYVQNNFDENDAYVIIYYTGSDTDKLNAIRDRAANNDMFGICDAVGWNTNYYTVDSQPDEGEGIYEYFYAMSYNNYYDRYLGWSEPAEGTTTVTTSGLMINSLDLSQATNLEKIEPIAFSNLQHATWDYLKGSSFGDPKVGLTSFTLGNNTNSIDIGGGAFAGARLSNLTLYNSTFNVDETLSGLTSLEMVTKENFDSLDHKDNVYYLFGAFGFSTIDNLTIKQAGTSTSFDGIEMGNIIGNIISGVIDFAINNVTIENGITELGDYSLAYIEINNISLPSGLTRIGKSAINEYKGSSLTLPNTLVTIDDEAFERWKGQSGTSLVIPSSVKTIGKEAFRLYGYDGNTSLTFNSGIQTIDEDAFAFYQGSDFELPSTITSVGEDAFMYFQGNVTVHSQSLIDNRNWVHSSATLTLAN